MVNYYPKKKCFNSFSRSQDFPNDIMIANNVNDYNIIISRNNNRRYNNWINNPTRIQGFDNKYYKTSSGFPKMQDTTSYFLMNKVFNFKYSNEIHKDTLDLMLIRQNIDKKQRYDLVNNKILKFGKYTLPSHRFNIN